jgi:hypothetical protein
VSLIGSERGRGRRRPSSIDRLDPQIKELIGKLRIDQGWTIDEIRARLLELQQNVSRSALGRHVKSIEEIGEQMRKSREIANALVARLGDAPEDKTAELNIELMHNMVMRLLTATADDGDGQPIVLDAEQQMFMARTIQSLAGARKTNREMIRKEREETKKEAAKAVDAVAKEATAGLSAETVDLIKRRIMGIAA